MIFHPRTLPLWLCMAIIFYFSSKSTTPSAINWFVGADKVAHFLAFFGLALCACYSIPFQYWKSKTRLWFLVVFVFSCIYAASDEFHQSFVPGRLVSWKDWLADVFGSLTAIIIAWRFAIWKKFG